MEFYVKSIVVAPNKSAIFNTFSSSEFWFLENFTLEYCTILWTSNFVSSEIVKNDRFWTDLCSLHNLEYTGFFYLSDFMWNQVWSFWFLKPQNCHFEQLSSSEFWFFENWWHHQVCNLSKNKNSKPSKLLKQQFLTSWNQPKLISRNQSARKITKFSHYGISTIKIPN